MTTLALRARPTIRTAWLLAILVVILALLVALVVGGHRSALPSNGRILFGQGGDIYAIGDDGPPIDLTPSGGNETAVAVSPDGSTAAFFETTSDGARLATMTAAGGPTTIVPTGHVFHPTLGDSEIPVWSRDGTRLAFGSTVSGAADDRGPSSIFVVELATGRTTQLPIAGLVGAQTPAFSPDGTQIAFDAILPQTPGGSAAAVGIDGQLHAIDLINVDGTGLRRLSPQMTGSYVAPGYGPPSWSPDGRTIAFDASDTTVNPGPAFRVFTIDVPTGALTQVTQQPLNAYIPRFSPDGSMIAFLDWKPPIGDLWVMRTNGSGQLRLRGGVISDTMSWSPDGQQILFDGLAADGSGADGSINVIRIDGTGFRQLVAPQARVAPRSGLTWAARP